MCLQMILADPDCDDRYMMLNANDGNSCACYPPEQAAITDPNKDCIRSSGREFYDIVDGCSGVAGENAQLDACGVCNGNNECFGTPPSTTPPATTPSKDLDCESAALIAELAAEKAKVAGLQAAILRTKAELVAAQSCKAYAQKGRRSVLAP